MIKVLIADDSLTTREKMKQILSDIPDIILVGEAENGKEAVTQAQRFNPDVIIMDLVMPVMSGLAAIEYLMSFHPCPIIVLSSATNRGTRFKLWDAMLAGAVASIEKPNGGMDAEQWHQNFVRTVKAARRIKVSSSRKNRVKIRDINPNSQIKTYHDADNYNVVVFGVSTGGPGIIAAILKSLPQEFELPILLVIHISESKDNTFVEWLNDNCPFDVAFATGGEHLLNLGRCVLVAPPGKHMVIHRQRVEIEDSPPVNFYRPSVDALFFSIAQNPTIKPVGILLTGMGKDGANGLKAIREAGGLTICQDENTSIVFGMPQAAININAADLVLSSNDIANKIMYYTGHPRRAK